ncbi:PIN domain-containing protein [Brevundimonas sp. FT23028]|uniref:PIN domain-containing protein n=1 Tax=Brevundimonas sp. FT23028 TaxID=3393748 RepID=UPI003B589D5D
MTKLVVDASAAASWLLASQATPSAMDLLDRIETFELTAPHVFQWEIGNLLVRQTRREPDFDLSGAFAVLDSFKIVSAPPVGREGVQALAHIAASRGLSLFDAGYLWLAMEQDAAVVSRDGELLAAATAAGLPVFDLRG